MIEFTFEFTIEHIQQKNLLLAQINSASLPEQKTAVTQLLINVRSKTRSLRKTEKTRKCRWRVKGTKIEFNVNPYKAWKNLLDPKCYCSLKVDQETLDQHKSSNLIDNNYDISLANLEGLPPEPPFNGEALKSYTFPKLTVLPRRNCQTFVQ